MRIQFDSDNLIYNRFDIIHNGDFVSQNYSYRQSSYEIQQYHSNGIVELNVWGKSIPLNIWTDAIEDVFGVKSNYAIKIVRSKNQYQLFLERTNDIRVPLPESFEDLMNRAERRDRATIRRKLRWLDERIGTLRIDVFSKQDIPASLVETYFKWKNETHGTEYGLTADEYLAKYYVTDAMIMKAGDIDVAVAFFCQVEDIVFFENFSYNGELKEYSPGLLMYVKFMEELIRRKCRYMYLGGGSYIYKKRFGAESSVAYSGVIFRQEIVDAINKYFRKESIETVAIYGYGVCGHSFYQLSKNLDINVAYAIDRRFLEEEQLSIYSPDEDLPKVDAILITLNDRSIEVEGFLKSHFGLFYYWNDIIDRIISEYRRSVNEIS